VNEFGLRRPNFQGPPAPPQRDGGVGAAMRPPPPSQRAGAQSAARNPLLQSSEAFNELKYRLHQRLIEELDPSKIEGGEPHKAREVVEAAARQLIAIEMPGVVGFSRDELVAAVCDEILGLGPIEPLLQDPGVSEVMVNSPDVVYFEKEGKLYLSPIRFRDATHITRIIERILAPLGRRVDESSPMVDARLMDGSRVNIVVPPVAPKSPTITIRKFRSDKMTTTELIGVGAMTNEIATFLKACMEARLNIIISGGTGSGKTTLLNALSGFISESERIVTIEDPTELKLQQAHVVTLEAKPPSLEGRGEVTQRDLLRNSLRMRPDRIIVGEVRASEAFDMMQAMNTGHDGSLSTVHANTPRDALARIENMILMAALDLPSRAIREQIAAALHMVVQVSRMSDGSRKVTHISEVAGMEGQVLTMQDIFLFVQTGLDEEGKVKGHFKATGIRPRFADKFEHIETKLPNDIYAGRIA
jgi:pilus assembly protein CpaF